MTGKKRRSVWSTSTTVADFLKRENIQLNDFDRLEAKRKNLYAEFRSKVVRVEKVTDVVEEPASFAVETRNDPSLLKGREKIVQEGKKGTVSREFEIVKENGKEVSRKVIAEKHYRTTKENCCGWFESDACKCITQNNRCRCIPQ